MRKIPETITHEELIKILDATKKKHHKLGFALGFYQCMRISEVVNLKPENVDKERRLIYIKQGKGKKDRNIPIAPEIMGGIKHLPINITDRALREAFHLKAKAILNKDLHFHQLRHSGATYYLNIKKWDVRQLQVFLGHSRINTTEIYAHVNPTDLVNRMWG